MKCPICGGTGETKNIIGKVEQTNFQYMQNCTMEEMAKVIAQRVLERFDLEPDIFEVNWEKKEILEWLKEKHNETV